MKHSNNFSFVSLLQKNIAVNEASAHYHNGDGYGAFLMPENR